MIFQMVAGFGLVHIAWGQEKGSVSTLTAVEIESCTKDEACLKVVRSGSQLPLVWRNLLSNDPVKYLDLSKVSAGVPELDAKLAVTNESIQALINRDNISISATANGPQINGVEGGTSALNQLALARKIITLSGDLGENGQASLPALSGSHIGGPRGTYFSDQDPGTWTTDEKTSTTPATGEITLPEPKSENEQYGNQLNRDHELYISRIRDQISDRDLNKKEETSALKDFIYYNITRFFNDQDANAAPPDPAPIPDWMVRQVQNLTSVKSFEIKHPGVSDPSLTSYQSSESPDQGTRRQPTAEERMKATELMGAGGYTTTSRAQLYGGDAGNKPVDASVISGENCQGPNGNLCGPSGSVHSGVR